MRILTSKTLNTTATARSRGTSAGGAVFSLDDTAQPATPAKVQGGRAAAPPDGLIAIQAEEGRAERRRRGLRRGRQVIDALDALKAALLAGRITPAVEARLAAAVADDMPTGEPGLDELLDAMSLRAEVELAKLAQARRRQGG